MSVQIYSAEMSLVICDNEDKCKSLLNNSPSCLKQLVHIKPISKETTELAKRKGINMLSFEYVEKLGAEKKNRPVVCRVCNNMRVILRKLRALTGCLIFFLFEWNDSRLNLRTCAPFATRPERRATPRVLCWPMKMLWLTSVQRFCSWVTRNPTARTWWCPSCLWHTCWNAFAKLQCTCREAPSVSLVVTSVIWWMIWKPFDLPSLQPSHACSTAFSTRFRAAWTARHSSASSSTQHSVPRRTNCDVVLSGITLSGINLYWEKFKTVWVDASDF